jgi:SAM-dependent methyltransferase
MIEQELEPYRELAVMYDELVGRTAFECWRENFERLTNRYSIAPDTACDMACGTGLAAAYLAGKCSRVYAVDQSESMLRIARSRAGATDTVFLRQSFTTLELPERVDLITCNFDSLNYLTEMHELQEAFKRFAVSLAPGGQAMFDMNTARELADGLGDALLVHHVEAGVSIWESTWDPGSRINTVEMTNFLRRPDGLFEMRCETHRERCYDLEFVTAAVMDAGFRRLEAFDARGLSEVGPDTRRVQFLAFL